MIYASFRLAATLHAAPAGCYVLDQTVYDIKSSKTTEASLPFSIVN